MKRYKNIVFICLLCVCMAGCGKQTSDTGIVSEDSEVFAENSIVETKEEFTGETLGTEEENTTLEDLEIFKPLLQNEKEGWIK